MSRSSDSEAVSEDVPHYTGSLDASIPNENIVCVQFDETTTKWIAVNKNTRGALHIGVGNTEILARRAAALRALANSEATETTIPDSIVHQQNLIGVLDRLSDAIEKNNEYRMREPDDQKRRLTEIRHIRDLLSTPGAFAAGAAAFLMTTLTYLAIKFADGIIGKLAEQAAKLLQKLVGG
jgi:hypothetical protein